MTVRTKINKETIKNVVFKSESGQVFVYLGNILILGGFYSLESAREAAQAWIAKNEGLQVEY